MGKRAAMRKFLSVPHGELVGRGGPPSGMQRLLTLVLALASYGITTLPLTVHAGTKGHIRGVVTDASNKEPFPGVTVVATSPALQAEEITMTDEQGRYALRNLPPGIYRVQYVFAGATAERHNVKVSVDRTIALNVPLATEEADAEVYTIEETAPSVDVSSTTMGITLTEEFVQNVPQGRSRNFEQALDVVASADDDEFGVSVGGATSPENSYVVDGLNITDPSSGLLGSRLVLDFVNEFDIKEGGYGPEFGRSTGGLINVVTKSGSNEFHGSVFLYYRPGWMESAARNVVRAGESIETRRKLDYYMNVGFEVGGPILKDKLWFHLGYAPEMLRNKYHRNIRARIGDDANGDGVPDSPTIDSDGIALTEQIGSQRFAALSVAHQFTSKFTHLIDENQRHSLALRGAPTTFDGVVGSAFDPDSPFKSLRGDIDRAHFDGRAGSYGASYQYNGSFLDDALELEGNVGWHHQEQKYRPTKTSTGTSLLVWDHPRNLRELDASVAGTACDVAFGDGSDRCVVEGYPTGGFGLLGTKVLDRWTEKVAATTIQELAGLHQIKFGLDFEQNRFYNRRFYAGGSTFVHNNRRNEFRSQSFVQDNVVQDAQTARSWSHNWALFLQDSWNPIPEFTLNYGVRWEAQEFYGPSRDGRSGKEKKLGIYDNWAPRIGAIWDFIGDGKSRAYVHWGRFYESIPLGLADRGFSGEGLRIGFYDSSTCTDGNGNAIAASAVTDPSTQCTQTNFRDLGSEDALVAPGLQSQFSNELIAGVDVELIPTWVFGFTATYRNLGNVIEDVSTDGGETYVIANPGNFDLNEKDKLAEQIAREENDEERARLQKLHDTVEGINRFKKPTREYYALQFLIDKKFESSFLIRASYFISWARGNYPGLFSSNNGQLDPNLTSQYDLETLLINRDGYLPHDRRHRVKIDGFYKMDFEKLFGWVTPFAPTVGGSLRLQSGAPIEVLGADQYYGADEVFLLPRGAGGRTPWTWGIDLHVGYKWQIDDIFGMEFFVDLYNITNNRGTTSVDETYTTDVVEPIVDGNTHDLAHARTVSGQPVRKNPNYKKATSYQAPFSGQLGFRAYF